MYKKVLSAVLAVSLFTALYITVSGSYADSATTQAPTVDSGQTTIIEELYTNLPKPTTSATPNIKVNGNSLEDTYFSTVTLNDVTYISIRSVLEILYPDATITWENGTLMASGENLQLSARPDDLYLTINGRYLYVPDGIIYRNHSTMAPTRTIAYALGADIQWDAQTKQIGINGNTGPLASGTSYYDTDELYWLSRIISAESRNQSLEGQIAVGNVIMNRVESTVFPDSIYTVIFSGIQFTPVQSGTIYDTPTYESVIAAKLVLDGAEEAGDSLFFNVNTLNSWASRTKEYVTTIGDHAFYI